MSREPSLLDRARDAATATERLARALASRSVEDPVEVAYLKRILYAAAIVEDRAEHALSAIEPASQYLGALAPYMATTAARAPG